MSKRTQMIVLVVLLVALAGLVYSNRSRPAANPVVSSADERFAPIAPENPALKMDLLKRIRSFEPSGNRSNIFDFKLPPPPPPVRTVNLGPDPLPAPVIQPVVIPVKFFGYVVDVRSNRRRAFFSYDEDVFILTEGETLLGRFKLLKINNNSADFEEVASGRRASVPLEEQPQT